MNSLQALLSAYPGRVTIHHDAAVAVVRYGVERLHAALTSHGLVAIDQHTRWEGAHPIPEGILIERLPGTNPPFEDKRFRTLFNGGEVEPVRDESFHIHSARSLSVVRASDDRGLLYGCLELAERIERYGWPLPEGDVRQSAAIGVRGVKFNLPYESYAKGEPFTQNEEHLWNLEFWRGYIDMLAESRYNLLSLWSEHPWHLLVTSDRFRNTNKASDAEMERRRATFTSLLEHAAARGIDVVLFTWNIALTRDAAQALGVPHIDEPFLSFATESVRVRQHSADVRDYIEEMVYQTLVTYPQLHGIGTSASETMLGPATERQQWVADTYVDAYDRSGRRPWFIQRTNMQKAGEEVRAIVQERIAPERFFISWKYAYAHAYSHPKPDFERLENAWDGVDLERTNVMYTVRNDDVNTHEWADSDYIREFVRNMRKPYVRGFYWGSDGYCFGRDFQHADYGHKNWTWDYERHRLQFQLWGRLSYDPDAHPDLSVQLLRRVHGELAPLVDQGLHAASKIIPAVNRIVWRDLDYQWHPEACLTWDGGFRTILDFAAAEAMPGVGVCGIAQWVREHEGEHASSSTWDETPLQIIELLQESAERSRAVADQLDLHKPHGLTACAALDVRAMSALGEYYAEKISAALNLNRLRATGDETFRTAAILGLERAIERWEDIAHAWGQHYRAYDMTRTTRPFGYLFYLEDVRRDVSLARSY